MINENRKLWKLILLTIPTLGIYNIYFWFRFTQDLNDMNREEKKIKNYILVWFLSIITLGIYRWVWLFYLEDRLQTTGETMGVKVKPGPGTVLFLWTFGKFILVGPLLADFYIIRNMNQLAKEYNAAFSKKTKVLNQKDTLKESRKKDSTEDKIGTTKPIPPVKAPVKTAAGTVKPVVNPSTVPSKTTSTNPSMKKTEEKPKVVNKQIVTPEIKTSNPLPKKEEKKPIESIANKETAATRETDKKASISPSTVTLDVEKNRPRANDATLTVNPGMTNMPMGKNNK